MTPGVLGECSVFRTLSIRDGPDTVPHVPDARAGQVSLYLMLRLLRLRWLREETVADWFERLLREGSVHLTKTLLGILHALVDACFPTSTNGCNTNSSSVKMQRLPQSMLRSVFERFTKALHSVCEQQTQHLLSAALCMQYLLLHNARVQNSGVGRAYDTDCVPIRAILRHLARLPPEHSLDANCVPPRDFLSGLVGLVMQHCPHKLPTSVMAKSRPGLPPCRLSDDIASKHVLPLLLKFVSQRKTTPAPQVRPLVDALFLAKPNASKHDELCRLLALISASTATLLQQSEAVVLHVGVRLILLNNTSTTAAAAVVEQLWARVLREHAFPHRWQLETAAVLLQSGLFGPWDAAQPLSWRQLARLPTLLLQERESGWLAQHSTVLWMVLCIAESLLLRVTTQALGACDTEGAAGVVTLCGSMLAQRLLELLQGIAAAGELASGDFDTNSSKSMVCSFLNWLFCSYTHVLKAVHVQGYAEPLVPTLVREVDALRDCLEIVGEILDRAVPPRTFGFSLSAALLERYHVSCPEECVHIAQSALDTLQRCYKQCDTNNLATGAFVRKTLPFISRIARACSSVLSPAIELMFQFSNDGPFHQLLSCLPTGEDSSEPRLELVLEENIKSLFHAAIALKTPLDSLLTRKHSYSDT